MKAILKTTAAWVWLIIFVMGAFEVPSVQAADCAVQGTAAADGEVLDAARWNTEWQNIITCANARIEKSGGQMNGNLDMNGADITLTNGNMVDGEDVSALGNRVDAIEDATGSYLRTSGGQMNGDLNMNGADITLSNGRTVDGEDVSSLGSRLGLLESATGSYLATSGGTLTGNLFLNNGADMVSFFTDGRAGFSGEVTVGGNFKLGVLKRFYFDGGFDSFLQEISDGTLAFFLNGSSLYEFSTSAALSRRDIGFDDAACEVFAGFPGNAAYACKIDGVDVSALAAEVASLSSGAGSLGNSIESNEITDLTVASVDLADDAVTGAKIALDTITSADIADSAVESGEIADGTILTGDLANGSVDTNKIQDGEVATSDITPDAIISALVADNVLTDNDLASGSVGSLEVANDSLTGEDIDESTLTVFVDDNDIAAGSVGSLQIVNEDVRSVDIQDGTVANADIANGAVTSTSIADGTIMAVDLNATAGITDGMVSDTLTSSIFIGNASTTNDIDTGEITDGTIRSEDIASNVVDDNDLANGSVGALEIATNAITSVDVADGTLTGDDIDELTLSIAIDSSTIADGSVTSSDILDGTIQSADIGNDVITSGNIAAGAVGASEVVNDSLTGDDIDETTLTGLVKTAGDTMTGTLAVNTAASNLASIQTDGTVRVGGDLIINPQNKFYLDGDGGFSGGGDTYIYEKGSNWLALATAGVDGFAVSGGDGIAIASGKRFFLDGLGMTGDTFIRESSANNMQLVSGGSVGINISPSGVVTFGADIVIAATNRVSLDGGANDFISNSATGIMDFQVEGTSIAQILNLTSPVRQGLFLPTPMKLFFTDSSNYFQFSAGKLETVVGGITGMQVDTGGRVGIGGVANLVRPLNVGGFIRLTGSGATTTLEGYDVATNDQRWWIGSSSFGVFDGNQLGIATKGTLPIELAPGNVVSAKFAADGKVFMPGVGTTASPFTGFAVARISTTTGEIVREVSSIRFKEDVTPIEVDSSNIFNLEAVSFSYKNIETDNDAPAEEARDFGYIAEEVNEVLPNLVIYDDQGPYSVRYDRLAVLLLEEMKKMKSRIEELEDKISKFKSSERQDRVTRNSNEVEGE
jgi:hypothetical protein